jgi:hypothetical protein
VCVPKGEEKLMRSHLLMQLGQLIWLSRAQHRLLVRLRVLVAQALAGLVQR